ncbi:unnamed protein product [Linum tenue]|uniref:RNase H type-1 domain-containing protein n=1 Tax=Linum tenue TaxID=586396 RepID=A0AAV0JZH8_9ROSI|nr:unnamed protein product [Linum tenue]
MVVEFGVQLAHQHRLHNVIVETDSLETTTKLAEADCIQSEIGVICRNVRRLLGSTGETSWRHVRRTGNEAAHIMTHSDARVYVHSVWHDRPPIFLIDELAMDNVTINIDQ